MLSRIAECGELAESIALALFWAVGMLLSIAGTFALVFFEGWVGERVLEWLGHTPHESYWTAVALIALLACALSPAISKRKSEN